MLREVRDLNRMLANCNSANEKFQTFNNLA